MVAKIRKVILFSVAGLALVAFAGLLLVETIERYHTRQRQIEQEIAKVSAGNSAYGTLWQKLVDKHGSQEAALHALRAWAEAQIDYREDMKRWRIGQATLPESPEPLAHFTTSEVHEMYKSKEILGKGSHVPYGCSITINAFLRKWDGPEDDELPALIMADNSELDDGP